MSVPMDMDTVFYKSAPIHKVSVRCLFGMIHDARHGGVALPVDKLPTAATRGGYIIARRAGIGRGIAIELWRAGAEVVAVSTTLSYLETLQKEYPSIRIEALDLSDWDNTRKVIDSLGHFDCLVNNAALGLNEDFLMATPENFDKLMNINVKSVLNVSQVIAKKMVDAKSGGAIVNVSSQASKAALWGHVTYAATKGALDAMTRVMAMELGPHNIRVNAVNPTVIMTDMGRQYWSDPTRANEMLSKIPLG
ncbi:hypothetical protein EVAR_44724_1, partial [Eumeta japonica]